jgi:hypothetical protein
MRSWSALALLLLTLTGLALWWAMSAPSSDPARQGGGDVASTPSNPVATNESAARASETAQTQDATRDSVAASAALDAQAATTSAADPTTEGGFSLVVTWSDGRPAAGAEILLGSLADASAEALVLALADESGRAIVRSPARSLSVSARHGEFGSLPRDATLSKPTRLVLSGLFSASGSLRPNPAVPDVQMRVSLFALDGARRVKLAERGATPAAPWSMNALVLPPSKQVLLRFESPTTMPIEVVRRVERPGENLVVDMDVLEGYVRPVRVVDAAGAPVEAAEVVGTYLNAFGNFVSFHGVTDAKGECALGGVPPREGQLFARKAGYRTTYYPDVIHALLPADEVWTITLVKAAPVRGRCVANGAPVSDFEVHWVQPGIEEPVRRTFSGRADGSFELDELGPGRAGLIAVSDELGQSRGVSLELTEEGVEGVLLEFGARTQLVGQVVDAQTEQPLEGALVQPWSASSEYIFLARGPFLVADADGRFRGEAFNEGANRIDVSAHGYASQMLNVFAESGKAVEAGVVRLARSQPFDVELTFGAELDPTQSYATGFASGGHMNVLPPAVFDAQGRLRFENAAPGSWTVRLMLASGYELYYELLLRAGRKWLLQVDAAQLRPWVVRVVGDDGAPWSNVARATVLWNEGSAVGSSSWMSDENGDVHVLAPSARSAVLRVNVRGRAVLDMPVGAAEFAQQPFTVKVGAPAANYVLLDGQGQPIGGGRVSAPNWSLGPHDPRPATTDAQGLAQLFEARDVVFSHASIGWGYRFGLEPGDKRGGVWELKLDPVGPLEVRVRDGAQPIAGVDVAVGLRELFVQRPRTDAQGLARTAPLNAGRWRVRCRALGYWPTEAEVEHRRGAPPLELQVRRLCDAQFEVRSPTGADVEGLEVELESAEFKESASAWLAAGRIEASAPALRTDRDGRLRVSGLPHGNYRWSVASGGEVLASGELVLAPRAVTPIEVRVP